MERKEVKSSQIKSIGHDPETNTLEVEFHSYDKTKPTSVYQYANITPEQYKALLGEGVEKHSIGSHFHKHVKSNPKRFPYTRISPVPVAGANDAK